MGENLEDAIINNLIDDNEYLVRVLPYLDKELFESSVSKVLFTHIEWFVGKYNKKISREILKITIGKQKGLSEELFNRCMDFIETTDKTNYEIDWIIDETEKWGKRRSIFNAINRSVDIISGSEEGVDENALPGILSDAISFGFDNSIGHDYFEDYKERFEYYNSEEYKIPWRLKSMNEITDGGMMKGTLSCIVGGTNSFKTGFLCDHSAFLISIGLNVLYISMEMDAMEISRRIDANRMNVNVNDIADLGLERFTSKIEELKMNSYGRLQVKNYPTTGANVVTFKSLLKDYELKKEFKPDAIIVDYLNICASSRFKNFSDLYQYNKAIAEELRGLAGEMDLPIYTATQLNRSGQNDLDPGLENVSESHGVAATVDFMMSISSDENLQEQNLFIFKQLKNRMGSKRNKLRFVSKVDIEKMSLYDMDDDEVSGTELSDGISIERNDNTIKI